MILKIVAFGYKSLRQETKEVQPDHPNLEELIQNMYDTMYNAHGVGLAAPQVDIPLRLFVIDGSPMEALDSEEATLLKNFKQVFINPIIIEETGDEWAFEEGCLSIPDIREEVYRPSHITVKYFTENFEEKIETYSGIRARIIQHEYDHLEGVLFTDYLTALRKRIIKPRLSKISKGKIDTSYPMKFPHKKR